MGNNHDNLADIVGALVDLEIALEASIENCLKEGCDFNDIKAAITTMVRKYESAIFGAKFRERIREHNKRIKSLNSVVGVKEA